MSHHVYTTKGIILRQFSAREADRIVLVLTRDLGLVFGSARGVRKLDSRLGPVLLDLSLVKISLVRGKHAWRITTAALTQDVASTLRQRRSSLSALARVAQLLVRMVRGEEKHAELYDKFEAAVHLLINETTDAQALDWELYTVARLLGELGYLPSNDAPLNPLEARKDRKSLVALVNDGIQSSGLT